MSCSSDTSSSGVGMPAATFLTPKSLLKKYPFPVAAYLRAPNCPPGLDLSKPLLIYSRYVSAKVRATSLRIFQDGTLARIGPTLVIPNSYTGWFALVTEDGRTARYFTTIEEVVSADVNYFLTRNDIPAYVIVENDLGITSYRRTLVSGGNVLKLVGICEDFSSRHSECSSKLFSCKKYAQCLDTNNQRVYLPLNVTGKFYSTGAKSSKSPSNVYSISHILKHFKLPISVKLICGYMPRAPYSFTGLLCLEKSQQEEVMLACTMTSNVHATFFEIEVASNFVFTPIIDPLFIKSPIYLKTLSYCQDESQKWQGQIKVTHHVTENTRRPHSLSRSFSEKVIHPLQDSTARISNMSFLIGENLEKKHRYKPLREKIGEKFSRHHHFTKRNVKKTDRRQMLSLSKPNTYVSQLVTRQRSLPEEPSFVFPSRSSRNLKNISRLSQSFDNLDYCRTIDDISPIPEKKEYNQDEFSDNEKEDHYATIDEIYSDLEDHEMDFVSKFTKNSFNAAQFSKDFLKGTQKDARNKRYLREKSNANTEEKSKKDSFDSGHGGDCDESYFSMEGEGSRLSKNLLDNEPNDATSSECEYSDEKSVCSESPEVDVVGQIASLIEDESLKESKLKESESLESSDKDTKDKVLNNLKSHVWLSEDIQAELKYVTEGDVSVISITSSSNDSSSSPDESLVLSTLSDTNFKKKLETFDEITKVDEEKVFDSLSATMSFKDEDEMTPENHQTVVATVHSSQEEEQNTKNSNPIHKTLSFSSSQNNSKNNLTFPRRSQSSLTSLGSSKTSTTLPKTSSVDLNNFLGDINHKKNNDSQLSENVDRKPVVASDKKESTGADKMVPDKDLSHEKINKVPQDLNSNQELHNPNDLDLKSKILMKGNTVVIRLNNIDSKRPSLNNQTFSRISHEELTSSSLTTTNNIFKDKNAIKRNVSTVTLNNLLFPETQIDTLTKVENRNETVIREGSQKETLTAEKDQKNQKNKESLSMKKGVLDSYKNFTKDRDIILLGMDQCDSNPTSEEAPTVPETSTPFSTNNNIFPENHILHNFDVKKLASVNINDSHKDFSQKEQNLIIKNTGNMKFSTDFSQSSKMSQFRTQKTIELSDPNENCIR